MSRLYDAAIALMMLFVSNAHADGQMPWLPNILSDHMVVQQGLPIPIWGRDVAGTRVTVSMAGKSADATADTLGAWKVLLPKLAAGGPYDLTVAGSTTRTVTDVLVGELWLGAGQSNMELAMRVTKDSATELPKADDGQLRLFTADRVASFRPEDDVRGAWQVCTPQTAKDFSAVAYHFGRSLREKLKQPVGMVVSSWGGTPAEDWTPRAALEQEPAVKDLLAKWDSETDRRSLWKDGQPFELLIKDIRLVPKDPKAKAVSIAIDKPGKDGLGGLWSHSEKFDSTGSFEALTGKAGSIGRYAGSIRGGAWGSALGPLKAGGSVDLSAYDAIELQVKGHGKFLPTLGQPSITDYDFYAGEAFELTDDWKPVRISLASLKQGGWGEHKDFTPAAVASLNFSLQVPYWPDLGALAYNGMVHPLLNLPFQGVIWYQGESNAGRASAYAALLGTMIKSWREAFQAPKLPFYIVQLPGWAEGAQSWAALREAQREVAASLQPGGLVTTLDVGESHDVHPKDKKPVGERLAALALDEVYHLKMGPLTPLLGRVSAQGSTLSVQFSRAPRGLRLKGDGGFEVAGADGVFHPATATLSKDAVLLSSPEVKAPQAVRHAWKDDPQAYASAVDGLPVPGFVVTLP